MPFEHFDGTQYWSYPRILQWCSDFVAHYSDFARMDVIGHTKEQRPIVLITLGQASEDSPMLWLDGGTHASEWAGVMATIYSLSEWARELHELGGITRFSESCVAVVPCISPDGYQAMFEGAPFLRSSLRRPKPGSFIQGLSPQDIDGDSRVRLMRWRDPAGPYVLDTAEPIGVRPRLLGDDPSKACFLAHEGLFVNWDGAAWVQAPRIHGVDLNRNFPIAWKPFSMFGMDGGAYPLSEPESRAVMDAVHARPNIAAALTNHTYTGALLTQPYSDAPQLGEADIRMMRRLAFQITQDTSYRVLSVYPDFSYDPKRRIVGVWADCLSSTLGIPAYTLELWNPFKWAGVELEKPASFFMDPDPNVVSALLGKASEDLFSCWVPFNHPQLGRVELGGIDYLRTIRNPPESLLQEECKEAHKVANALLSALPQLKVRVDIERVSDDVFVVRALFVNEGFLPAHSLQRALDLDLAPSVFVTLELLDGGTIVEGKKIQPLGGLGGWGGVQPNALYPSLPPLSHQKVVRWVVSGTGVARIHWDGGRAGKGSAQIRLM
ncbi:MAG: hypothetical protein CMK59_07030 [Proteobacteria bacterium]|nr:hypothetical protein [Pseudomonadota bacterium]